MSAPCAPYRGVVRREVRVCELELPSVGSGMASLPVGFDAFKSFASIRGCLFTVAQDALLEGFAEVLCVFEEKGSDREAGCGQQNATALDTQLGFHWQGQGLLLTAVTDLWSPQSTLAFKDPAG